MAKSVRTVSSRSPRAGQAPKEKDSRRHPIAWAHWLFLVLTFAMLATPGVGDRKLMLDNIGWYLHDDFKSWAGFPLTITPMELALGICFFGWMIYRFTSRHPVRFLPGSLFLPVLALAGFVLFGVIYGVYISHGLFNIALWEIRGFLMAIATYIALGIFIRTPKQANTLLWTILLASTVLAFNDFMAWAFLYGRHIPSDTAYDHTDSLPIVFTLVLCISFCLFKGTRKQRVVASLLIPFLFLTLAVMERRAAFAILFVGLLVVFVVLLRVRPRLFVLLGLPLCLMAGVYLAAYWNSTSTLGQPARAISSMVHPDPRDAASNQYRDTEKADILANIQAHKLIGLGFGQQFIFYYPLPDLSFWPFWHYTTHNADLWVWMKDGVGGYAAFLWVFGQALHDGGLLLETQREQWDVLSRLGIGARRKPSTPKRPRTKKSAEAGLSDGGPAETYATVDAKTVADTPTSDGRKVGAAPQTAQRARRTPRHRSPLLRVNQGMLPLLVTCVAYVLMQITFSYVDLGLTGDRSMFLFGLVIGLIARGDKLLGVELPPRSTARALLSSHRRKRTRRVRQGQRQSAGPRVDAAHDAWEASHAPSADHRSQADRDPVDAPIAR